MLGLVVCTVCTLVAGGLRASGGCPLVELLAARYSESARRYSLILSQLPSRDRGGEKARAREKARRACAEDWRDLCNAVAGELKSYGEGGMVGFPYCDGKPLVPVLQTVLAKRALGVDLDNDEVPPVFHDDEVPQWLRLQSDAKLLLDCLRKGVLVVDRDKLKKDNEGLKLINAIELLQDPENKLFSCPRDS